MVKTRNVAKRQKTEECTSCMESVLFNSDSLFKIASYLPAEGLLNLALTCRRFGIGIAPLSDSDGDSSLSLIEETARRIVQDIATDEQMAALPRYDGDNWLSIYHFFRLLTFDQLVGPIEYVEGNKSRVTNNNGTSGWATAFSNNIMMTGKHYASFEACKGAGLYAGVMRPGETMQSAKGVYSPLSRSFYEHFTQREGSEQYNNTVNCCMYDTFDGSCYSHDWGEGRSVRRVWGGMEGFSGSCKIGLLLDLDEGTLSMYKNGRKLGVMKRGLAGHYCWVVTLLGGTRVTIKRETVPAS